MWDLIVSVPDHCLSFFFVLILEELSTKRMNTVKHLSFLL